MRVVRENRTTQIYSSSFLRAKEKLQTLLELS